MSRRSAAHSLTRIASVLIFVVAALFVADRYLTPSFNSELLDDPNKFTELVVFYYGLLSIPVAWSVFPKVVGEPRFRSYRSPLVFSCFLAGARIATYLGIPQSGTKIITLLVGPILLFLLKEVLVSKDKVAVDEEMKPLITFQHQFGSALIFFGVVVLVELGMIIYVGGVLTFPYVTAAVWALIGVVSGLSVLRSYLPDIHPESLWGYMAIPRFRLRKIEFIDITRHAVFSGLLLVHVLWANRFYSPGMIHSLVYLGLQSDASIDSLISAILNAVGLSLLLAYVVTPFWMNRITRNMTEDKIDSILQVKKIERAPLLIQSLLPALTFGLIKAELFQVFPISILQFPRSRLLLFPSEAYILCVTFVLFVFGRLATRRLNRSYLLYSIGIVAAPVSPLFSAALDFFHADLKRRIVRYHAELHKQLPSIVSRLEKVAGQKDRLLVRLIALYGLTDEELVGGKELPGIRPSDYDSNSRSLRIHFKDLKSKGVSELSIPLDEDTSILLQESLESTPPNEKIFNISKMRVWMTVISLAKLAKIQNWNIITPYRLRANFMIYAHKRLPSDISEEMRSRKAF
jgi:hypothetical protein